MRATTQFIGVGLPKLQTLLSNRFIGVDDPALCQQFLGIAKTEREVEIQPDSMTDNFRWEAKAFVIGSSGVCFHAAILTYCSAPIPKLTISLRFVSGRPVSQVTTDFLVIMDQSNTCQITAYVALLAHQDRAVVEGKGKQLLLKWSPKLKGNVRSRLSDTPQPGLSKY